MKYNHRLHEAIKDANLKQFNLAEKAGIEEGTLSKIITGRLNPTEEEKQKIAKAVGSSYKKLWI